MIGADLAEIARRVPGPLGGLAKAGHPQAVLDLIAAFGGTKMQIPAKAEGSALAERIGLDAAAALIVAAGGGPVNLRIPSRSCLRQTQAAAVLDAIAAGMSNTDIARSLGVSDTYVSRLRKDAGLNGVGLTPADDRQLRLIL